MSTGNHHFASLVLQSHDMTLAFVAPYGTTFSAERTRTPPPHPGFNVCEAHEFIKRHGFAARAIGLLVDGAPPALCVLCA